MVESEPTIVGLGEDAVGWVEDQVGEKDRVAAFVDEEATHRCGCGNTRTSEETELL